MQAVRGNRMGLCSVAAVCRARQLAGAVTLIANAEQVFSL